MKKIVSISDQKNPKLIQMILELEKLGWKQKSSKNAADSAVVMQKGNWKIKINYPIDKKRCFSKVKSTFYVKIVEIDAKKKRPSIIFLTPTYKVFLTGEGNKKEPLKSFRYKLIENKNASALIDDKVLKKELGKSGLFENIDSLSNPLMQLKQKKLNHHLSKKDYINQLERLDLYHLAHLTAGILNKEINLSSDQAEEMKLEENLNVNDIEDDKDKKDNGLAKEEAFLRREIVVN